MPEKAKAAASVVQNVPVVLFGLDPDGKPKAARFSDKVASLAAKAATQLHLQVLRVTDAKLADTVAGLPVGRIHANGRSFVPYVRRDIYAKLVAAAGPGANGAPHASAAAGSAPPTGGATNPKGGRLPSDWDDIAAGAVVIAQESKDDGWYEAAVVERHDDMLILRWRDWPRDRAFSRPRLSVALMYPQPADATAKAKPASPAASKPTPAPKGATAPPPASALPRTWDDIATGVLVLAKEDGPLRGYWEAIVNDRASDAVTVHWRDYPTVAAVTRSRFTLALLHPNGN